MFSFHELETTGRTVTFPISMLSIDKDEKERKNGNGKQNNYP